MAKAEAGKFVVDPSWTAQRIAEEARAFSQDLYRDHPHVLEEQELFLDYSASKTQLWPLLTPEERAGLDDFPLVVVPTGDFDVRMVAAPSGGGKFILFDQNILLELTDFLAANPNKKAWVWAACILRGATRQTSGPLLDPGSWVEAPLRELKEFHDREATGVPYSSSMLFGLPHCIDFLLGHEYGHHALKHFRDEPQTGKGEMARITDHLRTTSLDMEFAADAWALNVISRLPPFELSSWLLAIELMFWYLSLIESFEKNCRSIEGITSQPYDHPPAIVRAERISRLGERVFETQLDEAGNLPQPLFNNLNDRQTIWAQVKKFDLYAYHLAEFYCSEPEKTLAIHNAVRAGEMEGEAYEKEMMAIARRHRLDDSAAGIVTGSFAL
jgi:hypothetical protein